MSSTLSWLRSLPGSAFKRVTRRKVGWCLTCKRDVYDDEQSHKVDGADCRVHEHCDYRRAA